MYRMYACDAFRLPRLMGGGERVASLAHPQLSVNVWPITSSFWLPAPIPNPPFLAPSVAPWAPSHYHPPPQELGLLYLHSCVRPQSVT